MRIDTTKLKKIAAKAIDGGWVWPDVPEHGDILIEVPPCWVRESYCSGFWMNGYEVVRIGGFWLERLPGFNWKKVVPSSEIYHLVDKTKP